jgi:hypothetical protein
MNEYPVELAAERSVGQQIVRPSQIQVERELEVLSQWMDNQFRIPVIGWRFGLNAVIDLVPGIGDTLTTLVALYVLASAVRYRVPKITLLRMGLNIAVYFVVGLIPWVGDAFDAWWKPNIRNITLLRRRATVSAEEARQGRTSDWLFVGLIILVLLGMLGGSLLFLYFVLRFVATHL